MRRARAGRLAVVDETLYRGQSTPGGLVAACRCCRCCWLLRVVGGWWLEVSGSPLDGVQLGKRENKQAAGAGSVKAQRGLFQAWVSLPRLVAVQGRGRHGEIDK